jgi:hypothetical protein
VAAMRMREHHSDLTFAPAQSGGPSEALGAHRGPRQDGPRDGQSLGFRRTCLGVLRKSPTTAGTGPLRAERGVNLGVHKILAYLHYTALGAPAHINSFACVAAKNLQRAVLDYFLYT